MIEFTQDGPFAEKPNPLFPDRVRILGLGQTGAAACDQITLHGRGGAEVWLYDTDQQTIDAGVAPHRRLLGAERVHGLGCNGDRSLAQEILAGEEEALDQAARDCDFLILLLGLGGATGVAAARALIPRARQAGAKVIVVGAEPFVFEGEARNEKARQAIAALRRDSDSMLVLAQDRLLEEGGAKNVRHGFHLMHVLLAQAAQALAQVVCKKGLIQLSFADVRSLFARYAGAEVRENCWAAHVDGDLADTPQELVERLLAVPALADPAVWTAIDHAIVAVSGARDMGLSDVQELVEALQEQLPVRLPIATSASFEEEDHRQVRMTVLFATTAPVSVSEAAPAAELDMPVEESSLEVAESEPPATPDLMPEPAPSHPVKAAKPARFVARQEEMQFDGPTLGRFEKSHETIYRGENLDQPTFRRRRIAIRL